MYHFCNYTNFLYICNILTVKLYLFNKDENKLRKYFLEESHRFHNSSKVAMLRKMLNTFKDIIQL